MAVPTENAEKPSAWWAAPLVVIVSFVIGAFLILLGSTINTRLNAPDYSKAAVRGTAVVGRCETKGPIGENGFGHYQACDVTVAWDNGNSGSFFLDRPGLLRGLKTGDSFHIGTRRVPSSQHVGAARDNEFSRSDLAHHGWLTAISFVIWVVGLAFVLIDVLYVLRSIKKWLFG